MQFNVHFIKLHTVRRIDRGNTLTKDHALCEIDLLSSSSQFGKVGFSRLFSFLVFSSSLGGSEELPLVAAPEKNRGIE